MKKVLHLTLAMLLIFSLASCTKGNSDTPTTPSVPSSAVSVQPAEESPSDAPTSDASTDASAPNAPIDATTSNESADSTTVLPDTIKANTPASATTSHTPSETSAFAQTTCSGVSGIYTSKIQGKIRNVFYTNDDNKVLISADKLYLYDLASGKVLSETERESVSTENYIPIKDGFVMVGQQDRSSQGGGLTASAQSAVIAQFYDSNLKKLSSVNLSDLTQNGEMFMADEIADVSGDGNLFVFATDGALYLHNASKKTTTVLIDCRTEDSAKRKGISIVEQAAFINSDKSVVFAAQSLDVPAVDGKMSFDTYGMIDIDGTNLSNSKGDGMTANYISVSRDFTFVADDYVKQTGKIMVLDNDTKKTATLTLTTKKESGVVFGSNSGAYFATSESAKDGLHIRVYDSETGKLVREKVINEDSLHMARDPVVRILDESKSLIVLLGNRQNDISTIVVFDSF